eukprot:COSAG02_NODE_189_length_30109_cov_71.135855_5_plen_97_part_00
MDQPRDRKGGAVGRAVRLDILDKWTNADTMWKNQTVQSPNVDQTEVIRVIFKCEKWRIVNAALSSTATRRVPVDSASHCGVDSKIMESSTLIALFF